MEQLRQQMQQAVANTDYRLAGRLQEEIIQLEEIQKDMNDAVAKGNYIQAGKLQERLEQAFKQNEDGITQDQYKVSIYQHIIESSKKKEEQKKKEKKDMLQFLQLHIGYLQFEPKVALSDYNNWKEDGKLPLYINVMVEYIIGMLKPTVCRRLEQKINLRGLLEDIVSTLLNPSRSRNVRDLNEEYSHGNDSYLLVHGDMQSGKTEIKALMTIVICFVFKLPMILITNKVGFSTVLKKSLKKNLLDMASDEKLIEFAQNNILHNGSKNTFVQKGILEGALLVLGDTFAKIRSATEQILLMEKLKGYAVDFVIALDESDAVGCRKDTIKLSQELKKLQELGSLLQIMVSATLIPNMLELMKWKADKVMCRRILPGKNHSGLSNMKPLVDENGDEVFLDSRGELSAKSYIPYWNDKVDLFLYNSLDCKDKQGILKLIMVNNRVAAEGNVFEQAEKSQDRFVSENKPFVAVTIVGSHEIHVRYPTTNYDGGDEDETATDMDEDLDRSSELSPKDSSPSSDNSESSEAEEIAAVPNNKRRKITKSRTKKKRDLDPSWKEIDEGTPISDVISQLNNEVGLEMPIVVFGFSQLCRGVSVWSKDRVVTHVAVLKGMGVTIVDVAQSLGRGNFQGLDILKSNGFDHVTVLTSAEMLDVTKSAHKFVTDLFDQVEKMKVPFLTAMGGMDKDLRDCFDEALSIDGDAVVGSDDTDNSQPGLPTNTNILRCTNRKVSAIKQHTPDLERIRFESPKKEDMNYSETQLSKKHKGNKIAQQFLKTLIDLQGIRFDVDCVKEKYEAKWKEDIKKNGEDGVRSLLRIYDSTLRKFPSEEDDKNPSYRLKDVEQVKLLLCQED